jgi:hypothetical protein
MRIDQHIVADAVNYCDPHSGASDEKVRGVLIGVVSGLMAGGDTFEQAIQKIALSGRRYGRFIELLPDVWQEQARIAILQYGGPVYGGDE